MGRTPGSRLAVVGYLQKVVKPWEDWDEIDGFMIIASAFPRSRRGKQFMRPSGYRIKKKKRKRHPKAKSKQPINHQKAKPPLCPPSPPSPPVPRVRLLLRQPPPPPPAPPAPPPPPPAPEPAPPNPARKKKRKKGEPSERYKAVSNYARHMRFEMICDLAGVPSADRPIAPPPRWKPPKLAPPPPPPRAPEPNLLSMGEVDLICWETMPPPTP